MGNLLKETPGTNLYLALLLVFMAMFAITGTFEVMRQMYYPENGMWLSLTTVFFVSVCAALIAYFPLRALIHTEIRLDSLLNGSPALQFVIGTDHRILSWNRALEIYSGIKEADVLGTTDQWKAFYPEKRPCLADLLIDAAIEKLPEWYEGSIRKSRLLEGAYEVIDFIPTMGKTGTWLYFTAIAVRDREGTVIGAVETLIDITERKKTEAALRESEDRFLVFIKEAAMRLKNPLEVVEENLVLVVQDIEGKGVSEKDILLQINLQVKNLEQIRKNIIELNKVIIEHAGDLSAATRRLLIE